jgi:hypothetical protein
VTRPSPSAREARERWGDTRAFQQSQQRAAAYAPADWARIRAEAADIERRLAALMHSGVAASTEESAALAEEHRRHLSRWFYDCSPGLHRELGELYVTDERFVAHYDEVAVGLAGYLRDAIDANAGAGDD